MIQLIFEPEEWEVQNSGVPDIPEESSPSVHDFFIQ